MAGELNQTPSGDRMHIAFYGRRNAGKSSLINALTGQEVSIVSPVKGTTTDPVKKAMELLPAGPVLLFDTPGIDDEGELGSLRVQKSLQLLNKTDLAILVIDGGEGMSKSDQALIQRFKNKKIPYLIVYNKSDLASPDTLNEDEIAVSALNNLNLNELRERIAALAKNTEGSARVIGDLIKPGETVVLITPIDQSAPKGRMILPQVQTLRDLLDSHAMVQVCQTEEIQGLLDRMKTPPRLLITDSQAFEKVKAMIPEDLALTSFSILFARYKGVLMTAVRGAKQLESLRDGDTVLISEGCTHHRQCEDIGTVKLPKWIENYTHQKLRFEFTAGGAFPEDLSPYQLVVHCGGCMLSEREMKYRRQCAEDQGIAYTNYGTLIAYMNGILERSLRFFPEHEEFGL